MAARTESQAVRDFLGSMQRTVSCVTSSALKPSKKEYKRSAEPHLLTESRGGGCITARGLWPEDAKKAAAMIEDLRANRPPATILV